MSQTLAQTLNLPIGILRPHTLQVIYQNLCESSIRNENGEMSCTIATALLLREIDELLCDLIGEEATEEFINKVEAEILQLS